LQSAYQLATAAASRGGNQTVALVDAFDDPNAEPDLAVYREQYGLPPCTTANGCFRKVNQDGDPAPLPPPDASWALEISLDLDMVSAVCPHCHILLAEADDNQDVNLAATVATAAHLGATEISNSYGGPEFAGETALEPFYDQPGIAVTASAGDGGYGTLYPAASANVTSVGGTSLYPSSSNRGWAETAWDGTGSGCSTQIPKPAWQHDGCTHRTDNDVAATASPDNPVAVRDTFAEPGWIAVAGTSVSSPIVAGVYALIGSADQSPGGSWFYSHKNDLFPVTTGSNGTCSPAYLCTAGPGYNGPTGLGTPDLTGLAVTGGTCTSGWSITPPQQAPALNKILTATDLNAFDGGIDALSPSDVWTAGSYQELDFSGPAGTIGAVTNIEHWNGFAWHRIPSPTVLADGSVSASILTSVSFDRPDDGWAAGYFVTNPSGIGGQAAPLVEHWDGSTWSLSPALDPMTTFTANGITVSDNALVTAVAADSPDDVWLAGTLQHLSESLPYASFLEHWNGSAWSLVNTPAVAQPITVLGLRAFSATDIWAVGDRVDQATGGLVGIVILHWDGRTWSLATPKVSTPLESTADASAIGGTSPNDVWVAGHALDPSLNSQVPFILHWDGQRWAFTPTAGARSVASRITFLFGVTATAASDAWAVGSYAAGSAQPRAARNLVEHWDGRQWTIVPVPQSSLPDGLEAVSATSATDVWAAGSAVVTPVGQPFQSVYPVVLRSSCPRR
jgi:Subtilase family